MLGPSLSELYLISSITDVKKTTNCFCLQQIYKNINTRKNNDNNLLKELISISPRSVIAEIYRKKQFKNNLTITKQEQEFKHNLKITLLKDSVCKRIVHPVLTK